MILIIAFGNDLREDDGAGLLLAGLMREVWRAQGVIVRQIAVQQLAPELAVDVLEDGVSVVVFVDTQVARSPADCEVAVTPVAVPGSGATAIGHRFEPGLVLAYAAALADEKVPPAWLVTTPGTRFGYGQGLSADASAAIGRALQDQNGALWWLLRRQTDATGPDHARHQMANMHMSGPVWHGDSRGNEERTNDRYQRSTDRPQRTGTPAS